VCNCYVFNDNVFLLQTVELFSVNEICIIYVQMVDAHQTRVEAIKGCIGIQTGKAKDLLAKRSADPENFQIRKQLGREQNNVKRHTVFLLCDLFFNLCSLNIPG